MLVAELRKGAIECLHALQAFLVPGRIVRSRQPGQAIAGHLAFFDGVQSPARKASAFIDKEVVHHASEPGAGLVDFYKIVQLAKSFDQEFLK